MQRHFIGFTDFVLALSVDPAATLDVEKCVNCYSSCRQISF